MPATSKAQWKLMKGLCEGSIKPREDLPSKKQACEYIKGQPEPPKEEPKKAAEGATVLLKRGFEEGE